MTLKETKTNEESNVVTMGVYILLAMDTYHLL